MKVLTIFTHCETGGSYDQQLYFTNSSQQVSRVKEPRKEEPQNHASRNVRRRPVLFRRNPDGKFPASLAHAQLTQLYAFEYNPSATSNYPDGETPYAELIQGADGNYYTTTFAGGSGACTDGVEGLTQGCGAVLKITPAGVLSVLYSFPFDSSNNTTPNGMFPVAGLVQGPDGNFYGVASGGGSSGTDFCQPSPGIFGCGTVFKITPGGTLTLLHSFCGGYGWRIGASRWRGPTWPPGLFQRLLLWHHPAGRPV